MNKPFLLLPAAAAVLLAACQPAGPAPQSARPARPRYDQVAAIRAAGDREKSVIEVAPLRDPGVAALEDAAAADDHAGRYDAAAAKLDQALKLSPDAPDLLQDRAEMAVRQQDYAQAEKLARRSWELGPKSGSLCARNMQTVVEMRLQAGDQAGADAARKSVQQCHLAGVQRY